jgi:integrase
MGKLTAEIIEGTKKVKALPIGKWGDGDGLQLVITAPGRGKWVYRYSMSYKAHEMGLGDYPTVGLTEARERALAARREARSGIDPIAEKHKAKVIIPTFGAFSASVIKAQTANSAPGYSRQWTHSLSTYAASIMNKRVDAISTPDVLGVLAPIWHEKAETARRVRNRIEIVLDAATAKGLRAGSNPAALKGHLAHLLGKQPKRDRHHAALAYGAMPAFVAKLRERGDTRAMALEYIVLTATRLSEAIEATWAEIDLDAKLWVIPAEKMKAGREHRVPLSDRCCQILAAMQIERRGERVFNISIRTIENLVRSLDATATTHGMRSAFRDWCGDVAHAPREIAEEALAHAVGNQTERAYRRGDALEQRRALMSAWAAYVSGEAGANVVEFASRRA